MGLSCIKIFQFCRNRRCVCNVYAQANKPLSLCKFAGCCLHPPSCQVFAFVFTVTPFWLAQVTNEWLLSLTVNSIKDIMIKMMKIQKDGQVNDFQEIAWLGVSRNFGISQESLMHNSVCYWLPHATFSMECCIVMVSFK